MAFRDDDDFSDEGLAPPVRRRRYHVAELAEERGKLDPAVLQVFERVRVVLFGSGRNVVVAVHDAVVLSRMRDFRSNVRGVPSLEQRLNALLHLVEFRAAAEATIEWLQYAEVGAALENAAPFDVVVLAELLAIGMQLAQRGEASLLAEFLVADRETILAGNIVPIPGQFSPVSRFVMLAPGITAAASARFAAPVVAPILPAPLTVSSPPRQQPPQHRSFVNYALGVAPASLAAPAAVPIAAATPATVVAAQSPAPGVVPPAAAAPPAVVPAAPTPRRALPTIPGLDGQTVAASNGMPITCRNCQYPGHLALQCPTRKRSR